MRHTIALANTARLGLVGLFSFAMVACGSTDTDNTSNSGELTAKQRQEVTRILRSRGFDVDTLIVLKDGMWLIEEDITFNPRDVLNGTVFRHDKGYAYDPQNPWSSEVYLVLAQGNEAISQAWLMAFIQAAADYLTNTNVTFASTDPIPEGAWIVEIRKSSYINPCTKAVTEWIGENELDQIVQRITLNSTYNGSTGFFGFACPQYFGQSGCAFSNIENLPADEKRHTATHELGHAFGVDHPPFLPFVSQGNHIPDTGVYDTGSPYQSVMYWGCSEYSSGDHVVKNLSADDILSLNTLYP